MTYSPVALIHPGPTPEAWLRMIERRFGKDYPTEAQKNLLLEKGISALCDSLDELETDETRNQNPR